MSKVLIVEDDKALQKVISDSLSRAGFEVHSANDGVAALNELQTFEPDLILLDIVMPKMNGIEFMQKLRLTEKAVTPVIVLSNLDQDTDRNSAAEYQISAYFTKANISLTKLTQSVINLTSVGKTPA